MIIITAVAFGQDAIQINFMEQSNQANNGGIEETLTMDLNDETKALTADIQDALVEVIDKFKLALRNPPEEIRRNRFKDVADEESDD